MYLGMVQLGSALTSSVLFRNASDTPTDGASAPTYRVYGPSGLMTNGTGTLSSKDPSAAGGTITDATNATPIVITSASHGLTTGTRVTVASVGGNTAANGDFTVTSTGTNTFSLDSSVGNGAYTSGGTWHTSGLYAISFTPTGANGFVQGQNYVMLVTTTVSSVVKAEEFTFTVV